MNLIYSDQYSSYPSYPSNEINEYEAILAFIVIAIPCFIKFLKTFLSADSPLNRWLIITASQYTNWNMCLVFINHFHNNRLMNIFITINSTSIFIVYHIFYFTNKSLIKKIPNIPDFCTDIHIDIVNVIVHVIPFIGYVYDYYKNRYICDYNMGYNVILFNMIWALQCFLSFDPHTVYFKVSYKNVYNMWVFLIGLNWSLGHYLQWSTNWSNKYIQI